MTDGVEAADPGTRTFRDLSGLQGWIASALLGALSLLGGAWALQLHYLLPVAIFREQFLGAFLGIAFAATFLIARASRAEDGAHVPWYDWVMSGAGLAVGGYIAIWYPEISYSLSSLSPERYLLGALAIFLAFEATRRLLGWTLIVLATIFCLYAHYAHLFPGLLSGRSSSLERIGTYIFLDTNGILGITLSVTATVVVAFILFGQALYAIRGDRFFTNIALALLGRYRGGTAKVAVLSSSLLGTVSGSVVSNVVVSGSVTIPMMKRSGYPGPMSAAIESVSSTGGQIMPPVMGVAAFIIAEYLGVAYLDVAIAAVIPAILYYVSLLAQVDLEAAKNGLAGLARDSLPSLRGVLRRGWIYLLPLALLVYVLLIERWPAGKAGMAATICALAVGLVYRESRVGPAGVLRCLRDAGRTLLSLVAISAVAGIVIGALQLSGLTFKFSLFLSNAGGGQMLLMLGLTAIVCIVLGLGMPTTVIYVMLAVLIAPALIELGVQPMAAHLFIFYFGMLSMITPPVCIATYTAASIAGTSFWKAGGLGMRLGVVAYIVPFIFVLHPSLLLTGAPVDILASTVSAVVGVLFIAVAAVGYLFATVAPVTRVLFAVASLALMMPVPPGVPMLLAANIAGLALGVLLSYQNRRQAMRHGLSSASADA